MEIKSEILKYIDDKISNNNITLKDLERMYSINSEELEELLTLTQNYSRFKYILKIFFMVYNQKVVEELTQRVDEAYINKVISETWFEEASDSTPEELSEAFLALPIFDSDLIYRVRSHFNDEQHTQVLDEQINSFIYYLYQYYKQDNFYSKITNNQIIEEDKKINIQSKNKAPRLRKIYHIFAKAHTVLKFHELETELKNTTASKEILNIEYLSLKKNIQSWSEDDYKSLIQFLNPKYIEPFYTHKIEFNSINENNIIKENNQADSFLAYSLDNYDSEPAKEEKENKIKNIISYIVYQVTSNKENTDDNHKSLLDSIEGKNENRMHKKNGFLIFSVLVVLSLGTILFINFPKEVNNRSIDNVMDRSRTTIEEKITLPKEINKKVIFKE